MCADGSPGAFAETVVPREHHAWGRFRVGSWKCVRVVSEELEENGGVKSRSVTDTTTMLVAADANSYTLQVNVTVEIAGKKLVRPPQLIKQGYNGELSGQKVTIDKIGDDDITLSGDKIPCETYKVKIDGDDTNRVWLVHYSGKVDPYVLRRETVPANEEGGEATYSCHCEVTAVGIEEKVLSLPMTVSRVKTVQKRANITTVTEETHCLDIPGGVVAHTSEDIDESGKVVRRSTLELLTYGFDSGERKSIFQFFKRRLPLHHR